MPTEMKALSDRDTSNHLSRWRGIRADFPIVLEEPVEFVLMVFADLASGSFRLARVMIRSLVVQELRVRGFPGFESLRCPCDRPGEERQCLLRQSNVVRQQSGDL